MAEFLTLGAVFFVLASVVALVFLYSQFRGHRDPSSLQERFMLLGGPKGKTQKEIVEACGPYTSQAFLPDGKRLLKWICEAPPQDSYQITLIFKGVVCEGVESEQAQPDLGVLRPAAICVYCKTRGHVWMKQVAVERNFTLKDLAAAVLLVVFHIDLMNKRTSVTYCHCESCGATWDA